MKLSEKVNVREGFCTKKSYYALYAYRCLIKTAECKGTKTVLLKHKVSYKFVLNKAQLFHYKLVLLYITIFFAKKSKIPNLFVSSI